MLERARKKVGYLKVQLLNMNAEKVDFEDSTFDYIILNLILSVAENPDKVLREAARLLKDDGQIVVFDKFSKRNGKTTFPRKIFNSITQFFGTDINRRFESILSDMPLSIIKDEAIMFGGNYRKIVLKKLVH